MSDNIINLQPLLTPHYEGVLNNLESTFLSLPTPIQVGKNAPPRTSGLKTQPLPYTALYLLPGGTDDGSLTNPQELAVVQFQFSTFAGDPISCLNMIDIARTSLSTNVITVTDRKVMSMRRTVSSNGANLDDTESDPAFMAFDRWTLRTSPA